MDFVMGCVCSVDTRPIDARSLGAPEESLRWEVERCLAEETWMMRIAKKPGRERRERERENAVSDGGAMANSVRFFASRIYTYMYITARTRALGIFGPLWDSIMRHCHGV